MIQRMVPFAAVGLLLFGDKLATDYTASRKLRFSSEMSVDMKTTSMKMERDGEPVEIPGGGGGPSSSQGRVLTWVDKVVEHKDGAPTKVQRAFGDLKSTMTMTFGENENTSDRDGALNGITLELSAGEDGKVEAKALEGETPPSEALVGHHLTLSLDAFLPDGEKADGDTWELDKEQVARGLGLDLVQALFPPKTEEPAAGGSGSGGGRSRGSRGGGGASFLAAAEWEGKATLSDATEDYEGATCRVIKLEISASGEMADSGFGGRGGRMFDMQPALVFATTYEVKLEGRLLFDAAKKMPVHLEISGTMTVESVREGEGRDGGTFRSESTQEGELKLEASCTIETE